MTQAAIRRPGGFELNRSKGRYGVSYLSAICAHYGVGVSETPSDEDVNAIDASIRFASGAAEVQVKCTTKPFQVQGRYIRWYVEPEMVQKWAAYRQGPQYILIVQVDATPDAWIDHSRASRTVHKTAAFWTRIPTGNSYSYIDVPEANRFTADTLADWHNDVKEFFGDV